VRSSDLAPLGIPRQTLSRLTSRGLFERIDRGLYVLATADPTEHQTLAEAACRVPHGVVCLLSALRLHGLTTQDPASVWIAIQGNARAPSSTSLPIRVVYMSGPAFEQGIQGHDVDGVTVRAYESAKTVADCFKYRSSVGLDTALDALRDYRRSPVYDADRLWHFAGVCRITSVLRPYLEALT
jgi:predicted transcriptional regulator of viral defense system